MEISNHALCQLEDLAEAFGFSVRLVLDRVAKAGAKAKGHTFAVIVWRAAHPIPDIRMRGLTNVNWHDCDRVVAVVRYGTITTVMPTRRSQCEPARKASGYQSPAQHFHVEEVL